MRTTDQSESVRCEEKRQVDGQRCEHPAKYLAPYRSLAVCGIHARGYLNCIPLADFDHPTAGLAAAYGADLFGSSGQVSE